MARARNGEIMLVLAAIALMFSNGARAAVRRALADLELENESSRPHRHAVKTIKGVDGDIIDCVDIYKQPAFDHPLLKNHTIQMRPSSYSCEKVFSSKLSAQEWNKNESCPEGTIPIQRIQKGDLTGALFTGLGNHAAAPPTENVKLDSEMEVQGGEAFINAWSVHVEPGEFSIAGIFVGKRGKTDFVAAGWMVSRSLFGDDQTRFFGYQASDSGQCFNLLCSGFVQTNKDIGFGLVLSPLSTYGGDQYSIHIKILRDQKTGDWWLYFNYAPFGYWPNSVLSHMMDAATYIQWGGQVYNSAPGGKHTSTQMGNGHFPEEGNQKAAFFYKILYYRHNDHDAQPPPAYYPKVDKPGCYRMSGVLADNNGPGLAFFYGGPGGPDCDH